MKTIQYFALAIGVALTFILLASGSIPAGVGLIYLVCLALPIIVD
jgi:hypothetical protein